jgi:hypothetical protein
VLGKILNQTNEGNFKFTLHPADIDGGGYMHQSRMKRPLSFGQQAMSEYFVAGGIYQDLQGKERFALLAPNQEDPPFLMINGVRRYFSLLAQHAHLYRVEKDYSLSLVAPSTQALQWGIKAPEKVTLELETLTKLQAVIC